MSLMKSLQEFLRTYDGMELRPIQEIQTGIVGELGSMAIAPAGRGKCVKDISGNRKFENNYVFYAKENVRDEIDRADMNDFLEDFSEWLEEQSDNGNFPDLKSGYEAISMTTSGGMLYDITEDGAGVYMIQIQMVIRRKRHEN